MHFVLGVRLKQVAKDKHVQVRCRSNIVCAMKSPQLFDKRGTLSLYSFNDNDFTKTNSFQLSFLSESKITISLGSEVLYVATQDTHCIHVISLDGTQLATRGKDDRTHDWDKLDYPRVAAVDSNDNLLVCDSNNNRLQMMTRDGKWQLLQCDEKIKKPIDAVVVGDRIFVVGGDFDRYICMLTISK